MITLTLKEPVTIPVEADCVTPDNLHDKSTGAIRRLPVYWGSRKLALGDMFDVEGERSEKITVVTGDCDRVKLIGSKMSFGAIRIKGNAGYNTGSYMAGGRIDIEGDTLDYLGAMMEGGVIVCEGDTGHFAGGAYKGETSGMSGGEIIIKGNAGHEVGCFMRRGLIAVGGDSGDFAGVHMLAGSIAILGRAGARAGANMKRGSIILMNDAEILPCFFENCVMRSPAIDLVLERARSLGLSPPAGRLFRRYNGDVNVLGKGEILVRFAG